METYDRTLMQGLDQFLAQRETRGSAVAQGSDNLRDPSNETGSRGFVGSRIASMEEAILTTNPAEAGQP